MKHSRTSCALLLSLAALLAGCPEKTAPSSGGGALPPAGLAGSGSPQSGAPAGDDGQPPALASAHGGPAQKSALDGLAPDTPVVTVNGVALTRVDLERAMIHQAAMLGFPPGELPPNLREVIESPAYEGLIKRELLRQEAERRGVQASDADVEKEKQRLLAQLPEGRTFDDVLKKMHTDETHFLKDLKADLSIGRLMEELKKEMPKIDEAAARRIYESNRDRYAANEKASASHILIAVAPDAPPDAARQAKERAEQIRAEVNGKDAAAFAKVARDKSDDDKSKASGGDLGTFERREVLPQFADVAFRLKKGEISEVVRTDKGFHIIRGGGVTKGEPKPFEEVKDRIITIESTEARLRFEEDLFTSLKAKATIVRHHEPRPSPLAQKMGMAAPEAPGGAPAGMHGAPPAGGDPHALPLPSKDNVLPGMRNPHGGSGDGLKLGPKSGEGGGELKLPAGGLGQGGTP